MWGDGQAQVSVLVLLKGEEVAADSRPEAGMLEGGKTLVQEGRLSGASLPLCCMQCFEHMHLCPLGLGLLVSGLIP